jgi:hypothetical protein
MFEDKQRLRTEDARRCKPVPASCTWQGSVSSQPRIYQQRVFMELQPVYEKLRPDTKSGWNYPLVGPAFQHFIS